MAIAELHDVRASWDERDRGEYEALCASLPLLSIHDDAHLDTALACIDRLVDAEELSAGAAAYLEALTDLVSVYEDRTVTIPRMSGLEVLRQLMEWRAMHQKDLVGVFGGKSTVSEVLSGKRRFTLDHVARLGAFFGVPAGVFIDALDQPNLRARPRRIRPSRSRRPSGLARPVDAPDERDTVAR